MVVKGRGDRLRILYVTTTMGTIESFLIPHIKLLADQGHEVDIACNSANEISPELLNIIGKAHMIEFKRIPFKKENYKAYKEIKSLVKQEKYEIVHTHTPVASFFTRMACRAISSTKVLYTAHGFHFFKGAPLKNWLVYYTMERLAAKWTDGIITINKEDFDRAKKMPIRGKGKSYMIPGVGVNNKRFIPVNEEEKANLRKEYGLEDNDFLLIFAAEINNNKNQGFLIKSVALLKDRVPNIKLILAGEGEIREKYEQYANSLGLKGEVIFLGFRDDLDRIVPMCDIGVSSSRREGFGINVVEYMSSGLPVVVSDNRGHREIVDNGVNGYLFEQENTIQFINYIEKLYKDKDLRDKMGKTALCNSNNFSIEKSLVAMESIYQEWSKCCQYGLD